MNDELDRDLTTLEYIILGQVSLEPQSGYGLITTFESGMYRWSGSPGSVYPILKRLEKQGILGSELEMVHETRPRKIYSLTQLGEKILDDWLRRLLTRQEVLLERDVVLTKFLFIERRLTHQEILAWLDQYEQETEAYQTVLETTSIPELQSVATVHQQLIRQASEMEMKMQRQWIQVARRRLEGEAGEGATTDQED
jgi:DNA-binding PadR family transcriptional regulator